MPIQQLPFNKGTKSDLDSDFRDSLAVNYISVPKPEHPYMKSAPGLSLFANGVGIDRGGIWNERHKNHYRVSGGKLISVNQNHTVTELGDIPQSKQVSLTYSFNTQAVFNDGGMYLYDSDNGLRQVADPDLGRVFDGVWIDGYYWMTDGESIVVTELIDETAVDPLKYGSSEYSPDPIVGVGKTTDNKGIAFNRYSIEYFVNTGSDGFPFQRIASRGIMAGLVGTHAKCEVAGTYAIIGGAKEETPSIHLVGTGALKRIASREVDEIMKNYTETELSESVLEARVEDSHSFIICRLKRDTLMYDMATMEWVILSSTLSCGGIWRAANGVYDPRIGEWVYGDSINENIGKLDESVATHYNDIVEGILYTPIVYLSNVSINEMRIKHLPGRGAVKGNPRALLSMSNNGLTYQPDVSFEMGGRGNYERQFIIRRLGYIRNYFSLRIRLAVENPTSFTGLSVEYN